MDSIDLDISKILDYASNKSETTTKSMSQIDADINNIIDYSLNKPKDQSVNIDSDINKIFAYSDISLPKENYFERLAKDYGMGAASMVEGLGGALKAVGISDAGQAVTDYADSMKELYKIEDPTIIDDAISGVASMASFLIPGAGITKAAKVVSIVPKVAKYAEWLGVLGSSALESVIEAGNAYQEKINEVGSHSEAQKAAAKSFVLNMSLLVPTNKFSGFLKPDSVKTLKDIGKGFFGEVFQEYAQEIFGEIAQGREGNVLTPETQKSALSAGLIGGVLGGGVSGLQIVSQKLGGQNEIAKGDEGKALPEGMQIETGKALQDGQEKREEQRPEQGVAYVPLNDSRNALREAGIESELFRKQEERKKLVEGIKEITIQTGIQNLSSNIGKVSNLTPEQTESINALLQGMDLPSARIQAISGQYNEVLDPATQKPINDLIKQQSRGATKFYQDNPAYPVKAVIVAFKGANFSTAVHEIAHIADEFMFDLKVPKELRNGIEDSDIINMAKATKADIKYDENGKEIISKTVKSKELFGRMFEKYLRDGTAPNKGLRGVFQKISSWMKNVYKKITSHPDLNIQISPEVKSVFDKLVTRGRIGKQSWESQEEYNKRSEQPKIDNINKSQSLQKVKEEIKQPEATDQQLKNEGILYQSIDSNGEFNKKGERFFSDENKQKEFFKSTFALKELLASGKEITQEELDSIPDVERQNWAENKARAFELISSGPEGLARAIKIDNGRITDVTYNRTAVSRALMDIYSETGDIKKLNSVLNRTSKRLTTYGQEVSQAGEGRVLGNDISSNLLIAEKAINDRVDPKTMARETDALLKQIREEMKAQKAILEKDDIQESVPECA